MLYDTFFAKSTLNRAIVGVILTLFALASIFATFPIRFAHAAGLATVLVTAVSDDTSGDSTLNSGDSLIVGLDYRASFDDLQIDPAGACTVNGKDVKSSFQDFGDGTYQLVYTVASGDANAAAGAIPFSCAFKDSAGNSGTVTGFTTANTLAINSSTGGINNNDIPAPATFESTVSPSTGTAHVGDTVTVTINDKGGITDFAVDPAGTCTVNGKDVKSSFQSFGDHHYQVTYTVAEGDADVAAGQLAISCNVKNPAGTTGTINTLVANTLAIDGTADTGGNDNGGNNNGGNNNGGNTGTVGDATVQAIPSSGTFTPGQTLEIRIHQNNNMTDLTLNGDCKVNNVPLTMQNLGGGDYKLLYTVGATDQSVAAGQLQFSCNVKNGAGQTATLHFTDGNQVVISVPTGGNNNGGNTNTDNNSETDGNINGNVQGGTTNEDNGVLAVTQINQIKSVATADGTIPSGWKWEFMITVPSNEPKLQLKFDNWTHSNGINSISPANNMVISTDQASVGGTHLEIVTGASVYTAPLTITGDLNASMPGKQVKVVVEMGVPVGSANGSYSTTYHVKTSQQ